MKAEQLRISNYVKGIYLSEDDDVKTEVLCEVLGVCMDGTYDWPIILKAIEPTPFDITEYDEVVGIPLTEEWLLNFGFKKKSHDESYWFELKVGSIEFISNDTLFNNNEDKWHIGIALFRESAEFLNLHIKHVHQLQNLFFALTGEELTLKQ